MNEFFSKNSSEKSIGVNTFCEEVQVIMNQILTRFYLPLHTSQNSDVFYNL